MNRSSSIQFLFAFLVAVIVAPVLAAQSVSGGTPSANSPAGQLTSISGEVRQCVEELDVPSCARARKLPLSPQKRSLVLTYEFVGQPPLNGAALDKAIALDPQNALAYFLRGMFSTNYDEGLKSYLKAIELNPQWNRYYVDAALLADNAPDYKASDEGLKLWQAALDHAPDDPRVYAGFGNALKSRGRLNETEAMYQRGLAANPDDVESASDLCSLYLEQKNFAKLRPACKMAVGFSSPHLEELAWRFSEIKEYALAESAYRKAWERGFDEQHTIELNLASTLLSENKALEAAQIYKAYLAEHPDDATYMGAYAGALEAEGDLEGAEQEFAKAADDHSDCGTHGSLGLFYLRHKRYQETFDEFDRAFREQWDCPMPVYALTQNKEAFGADQGKITDFEKAMLARALPKEDEKTANNWYRFANLAHEFGRNDEAAKAYRKAADLSPKQAFPLGGLGWALYDAGHYQEAIAAFEEAEKRQPGYLKSAPEVQKRYEESLAAAKGRKK